MHPYPGCTMFSILMHPLLVSITFSTGGGAIYDAPKAQGGAIYDAPKSRGGAIYDAPKIRGGAIFDAYHLDFCLEFPVFIRINCIPRYVKCDYFKRKLIFFKGCGISRCTIS